MKHYLVTIPVLLRYTYHETEPLPDKPEELEPAQDPSDFELELPDGYCFSLMHQFGDEWEDIVGHIWTAGGYRSLGLHRQEALKLLLGPHRRHLKLQLPLLGSGQPGQDPVPEEDTDVP